MYIFRLEIFSSSSKVEVQFRGFVCQFWSLIRFPVDFVPNPSEPGLDLNVSGCGTHSLPSKTGLFFYSASSCSSHHLTAYPKPRGSRRGYWPSLLPREMPPRLEMATILYQRETPPYEVLVPSLTCCTTASIQKITAGIQ